MRQIFVSCLAVEKASKNEKSHMVFKSKFAFFAVLLSLMVPLGAGAEITVSITAVLPLDGIIAEGESATVYWNINPETASGDYDVVIGGDGTVGSGDPITSSDGSGTFNGTTSGSSTVSAANDLDGDGEYVVYVIAVDSEDDTNYGSANTTVRLDSPPEMVNGLAAQGGDGRIFLSWDVHNDDDIINYLVYYDTDSGSTTSDFVGVDSDLGTSPVNVGDTTEVILSGMENGVKYYMRVTVTDETERKARFRRKYRPGPWKPWDWPTPRTIPRAASSPPPLTARMSIAMSRFSETFAIKFF